MSSAKKNRRFPSHDPRCKIIPSYDANNLNPTGLFNMERWTVGIGKAQKECQPSKLRSTPLLTNQPILQSGLQTTLCVDSEADFQIGFTDGSPFVIIVQKSTCLQVGQEKKPRRFPRHDPRCKNIPQCNMNNLNPTGI